MRRSNTKSYYGWNLKTKICERKKMAKKNRESETINRFRNYDFEDEKMRN